MYQFAEIFEVDILSLLKNQDEITDLLDILAKKKFDVLLADLKKRRGRLENFDNGPGYSENKKAEKRTVLSR